MQTEQKSFWEHLDDLRAVIIRMIVAVAVAACTCFVMCDTLFDFVFAPASSDFLLYRLLPALAPEDTGGAALINTSMTGQLMTHLKVSGGMGIVVAMPIALWMLANYVRPALYANERRAMGTTFLWGTLLFYAGMGIAYGLVFPISYRFLLSYSVSESVTNMITLESYIDNLLVICLLMGILFELPVVTYALSRAGIVSASGMRHYRRHAILGIVTLTAIATPTTDIATLALVSLPIIVLYEASILVIRSKKH